MKNQDKKKTVKRFCRMKTNTNIGMIQMNNWISNAVFLQTQNLL